jgi:serine protease Do
MSVASPRAGWSGRNVLAAAALASCLFGAGWWATNARAESDAGSPAAQASSQPASIAPAPAGRPAVASYADAVAKVAPAVVTVRVELKAQAEPTDLPDDPFFRRFFGPAVPTPERQPHERGLGSGVIVSPDGRILTNAHVVDGATAVRVTLNDGREFTAKVVGVDKPSDLAVVEIPANHLPTLPLGDSDRPRVGDVVLAIGNPLGIGETVTMGILSAKGRTTGYGDGGGYEDFLQTDAPINRGNSGGALVTAGGELIGITSQILSPSGGNIGIGFAIPSNMARHVMSELVSTGHVRRAMLGVTVQPLTTDLAKSLQLADVRGALVNTVQPDGPAATAGIRSGDVITAVNGVTVQSSNDLRNQVSSLAPGSSATVSILRNGHAESIRVALGEVNPEMARNDSRGEGEAGSLGLTVEPLTPEVARKLEVPHSTDGLVVDQVDPNGVAAAAGIEPGDVIRQVDGKSVRSASELREAFKAKSDRPALVLVQRHDQTYFAAVERS